MMLSIPNETLAHLRVKYPIGARVELLRMDDDPRPVPVGTRGTVQGVDDMGSIMVAWDNGQGLHVLYGKDECRIIEERG